MSVSDEIESAKQLQLDKRLRFLDFLLNFRGWFTRQDLIDEFKVAPAGATRDIAEYRKITSLLEVGESSNNVELHSSQKKYVVKDSYKPKYELTFGRAISILRRSLNKGRIGIEAPIPIESPERLCTPSLDVLSLLSRSIGSGLCVDVEYGSLTSGNSKRRMSPHSFFESESNWYVRAFCYKRNEFRNFKFTRFTDIALSDEVHSVASQPINDNQWQRWVKLVLAPHPKRSNQETLAHDYKMNKICDDKGKVIYQCAREIKVRAAVCGFWLQDWNVDCSENGEFGKDDARYQLMLENPETLYDVETAMLAPGR